MRPPRQSALIAGTGLTYCEFVLSLKDVADVATERDDLCGQQHSYSEYWPDGYSAICLDPPPGELAEPITLRDKLACVWKQLLAALSQISVAVDLRSVTRESCR